MPAAQFNNWRAANDIPRLFKYLAGVLPLFEEWVASTGLSEEQLHRFVPLGDLFKGDTAQHALTSASNQSASLGNQVQQLKATLSAANSATNQANAQIKLLDWTHPYRVEFLGLRNPFKELARNTIKVWTLFGNTVQLGVPSQFKGGINPAGFYWALTHASTTGSEAIKNRKNEDAMTADFVDALKNQLGTAANLMGSQLDVYANSIQANLKPALKEVSVGADLLLVVSGDGLVPNKGVRLLWVQFKQTMDTNSPLVLDAYRKPNAAQTTQLDALRKTHAPASGSFAIYALASIRYDFFASIAVDALNHVVPKTASTCQIDLAQKGVRFQELALAVTSQPGYGEFSTGDAVIKYVDALASQAAIVPLAVLSVSSGQELVSAKDLARQIKAGWDRRLREYIATLTRDQKQQLQIENDGPSLEM